MLSNTCPLCGCEVGVYEWGWAYAPDENGQISQVAACDVCAEQNNLGDLEW
jgi:hypothetical protein